MVGPATGHDGEVATMPDTAAIGAFIERYRTTFASFDVEAIGACFAFPLQVTGEGGAVAVVSVPVVEAWLPQLERIAGAYRALGVTGAEVAELRAIEVTQGIAHAVVHWSLRRADGSEVYGFTASYTLADLPDGTRIVAIAHDESPKLMAAVAGLAARS